MKQEKKTSKLQINGRESTSYSVSDHVINKREETKMKRYNYEEYDALEKDEIKSVFRGLYGKRREKRLRNL